MNNAVITSRAVVARFKRFIVRALLLVGRNIVSHSMTHFMLRPRVWTDRIQHESTALTEQYCHSNKNHRYKTLTHNRVQRPVAC